MKAILTTQLLNNIQEMLDELKQRVLIEDQVIEPKPRKSVHIDQDNVRKVAINMAKEIISKKEYVFENNWLVVPEFIINYEKKTIVALIKGAHSKTLRGKGIAKCDPADVFNINIGKAIALYRALKRTVPEFLLTAPNPTEIEVGDIIGFKDGADRGFEKVRYKVKSLNPKVNFNLEIITRNDGNSGNGDTASGGKCDFAKIIDDSKE